MAVVGVVYLYRFAEGEFSARAFLESYRAHHAGIEHDVHVVLKGFPDERSRAAARALFASLSANLIELDDAGYDIGSYLAAARQVANKRLAFLNTFSEILADNWLAYLDAALDRPDVGVVGATGSWQSLGSAYTAAALRLAHWLKHPVRCARIYFEMGPHSSSSTRQALPRRSLRDIGLKIRGLADLYEFGRYPNPHIRTNAFMMDRERFLSLRHNRFRRKADVYKFESGRDSMTNQLLKAKLKAFVVDRSGRIHDVCDCRSSSTFWSGDQQNLMIADNMTRKYALGSGQLRELLENYAWHPPSAWPIWPRASTRA